MNPTQRKLIKEAYQAGYREALDENIFSGAARVATKIGKFLKKILRGGGDVVDSAPKPKKKFKLKPLDPPEPVFKRGNISRTDDPFGPNRFTAAEDRYLANLKNTVSDLEGEIIDQMGNDGREIINNMNKFGKNLSDEQKIKYYLDILRQEAQDLPDINNPLDDLP